MKNKKTVLITVLLLTYIVFVPKKIYASSSSCTGQIQCESNEADICCPGNPDCTIYLCYSQSPEACAGYDAVSCESEDDCPTGSTHVGGNCTWFSGGNGQCTPGDTSYQVCGVLGCASTERLNCTCDNNRSWVCACETDDTCPPPTAYCGDGTCNNGETNCTCSDCTGTCDNPPPGPYCGDGTCNNGETNCTCDDCSGTCPPPGGSNPSCTVSLSPSSVNLYTNSNPFNITATVSNIQDGSVSQVNFVSTNNLVSFNPSAVSSSPYQSSLTPITGGDDTISAQVFMGNNTMICSATSLVHIIPDEAPDCFEFTASPQSVTAGTNINLQVEITDSGPNYAVDGGFEIGSLVYWPTTHQIDQWLTQSSFPPGPAQGTFYAKVQSITPAGNPHNPHVATDWIETNENLSNQNYTLRIKSRSDTSSEIGRGYLQREPYNNDWTDTILTNPSFSLVPNNWKQFETSGIFATPTNGSNTTRFRIVLFPGAVNGNSTQPIYFDDVQAYKTSTGGVDYNANESLSSVKFYYILSTADHTVPANWTQIDGDITKSQNTYTISFSTASIPTGDYDVVVNASDIATPPNNATGNPDANTSTWTIRPACLTNFSINSCTISCTEDCGTGYNLSDIPTTPQNLTVNGQTSGQINLTADSNLTFAWNASTIHSPATIDQYHIVVWDYNEGQSIPANCNINTHCVSYSTSSSSLSTTVPANAVHGNHFYAAVRSINTCGTNASYSNWSQLVEIRLVADVSGNIVEQANTPDANNNCPNTMGPPVDLTPYNPNITISTTGNLSLIPGDSYQFTNVPYAPTAAWAGYGFDITLSQTGLTCMCPTFVNGNCTHTNTASPAINQNFYISTVNTSNSPWWQASEGNVYSAQGFTSNIPDSALTYLITQNAAGNTRSAGIPLSGGTVTAGTGWWTEYNGGSTQPRAYNTTHTNIVKEDYDFFVRNVDLNTVASLGASITTLPNPATGTLIDGARVFKRTGDLALNLSALQTVTGGTKMVIFVSGNATISNTGALNRHMIDIDSSSYLAIIAGGNITFDNTIGNTCAYPTCTTTNTNIDGVYIASGQLIVDDNNLNPHSSPDNMFVGEGTFVGWGGIDLQRTFDNTTSSLDRALNNTYATEVFTFRPDFTENTPEILRRANLVWQEVN